MENALSKNKSVLVHCKRGHHRSASIIAAFLMKNIGVDYLSSMAYINNIRPCALRRNTCMVKGLFNYYLECNGVKECNCTGQFCNHS